MTAQARSKPPALARLADAALAAILVVTVLFWLGVTYLVFSRPANHIGWDLSRFAYLSGLGLLAGLATAIAWRRKIALGCALVSALSLGASWGVDAYNVLVPYEVWLKRGMPERGERSLEVNTR
jgi:hypothetical protein